MNFGKLQLGDDVKRSISAAADSGTLSHALLLTGGTEEERKELSLLLAQAIICESPGEKPCLKCTSCSKIKAGIHPDVTITPDESAGDETGKKKSKKKKDELKSISIDEVREIRNKAHIIPNEAAFQIFIINGSGGIGEEAQNALLKILEEPPATARFILTSRSSGDFLRTILSRVTSFAISEDSGQAAGENENPKAAEAAADILTAVLSKNEYKIILSAGALESDKKTFKASLEKMIIILRNAVISRYRPYKNGDAELVKRLATSFSDRTLIEMQEKLKNLLSDANKNANDNLLITKLSIELTACTNGG